jgi:seryl-tRNA(Sec) selenium transferase
MDWTQVMTIVGANMALFLWATRQARTDFLHTCRIIESIQTETKQFHGRLSVTEEKIKNHKPRKDA